MGQGSEDVISTAASPLMCRIGPTERLLINSVEYVARTNERPTRPLHLQALLQLPRLADTHGFVALPEAKRLLTELVQELPPVNRWIVPDAGSSPRLLRFHKIETDCTRGILERFHYLRSPRADGRAYGLSTESGNLAALCVSSPLDVETLRVLLHSRGRPTEFARVLSRVFAFEGVPKNSISYMLSRTATEERRLGATDFVTYVNPNMGFTGSSYRASGWQLLGRDGTKYRYLDGRYITDRELAARFATRTDAQYHRLLGPRFVVAAMSLEPLLVFHSKLD